MFFLNLSLGEFAALFTAASGLVFTLYLLNRARRKQTVATLKFWVRAEQPIAASHRRRIQQPFSLLLQILSIALLLLALAQLRIGSPDNGSRDHVMLLDTSAWTAARARKGTILDEEKAAARAYLKAIPSSDRVMLVRADALSTPVTAFETNHQSVEDAIQQSRPGAAALNLEQALAFASQTQKLTAKHSGEIVYVGPGRVLENDPGLQQSVSGQALRVLPVTSAAENVGLRKIGLRRSPADSSMWDVFVSVRNYGTVARSVPLTIQFGGGPVASKRLLLTPGKDEEATFQFRTRAAGVLEARLLVDDALMDDNRALLELPQLKPLPVTVYTDSPELLKPVLSANPQVEATYLPPVDYDPAGNGARIIILDRFRPKDMPKTGSIWIEPPAANSPVRVRTMATGVPIARWRSDHALGAGLRTKQVKLESTQVYSAAPGDIPVAEVEAGPVILAHPGVNKLVVIGFHPGRSAMRFELATPILFANILRWMQPEVFRQWETFAGSAGAVTVPLDADAEKSPLKVINDEQQMLPYTVHGHSLRFFSGAPGTVRVITDAREQVYSLTLPEIGSAVWQPPASAHRGIPSRTGSPIARDVWQLLAILGAVGLFAEWILYGRSRSKLAAAVKAPFSGPLRKAS